MKLNKGASLLILVLTAFSTGCLQSVIDYKVKERIDGYYDVAIENTKLESTTKPVINAYFSKHASTPMWMNVIALEGDSKRKGKSFGARADKFSKNDKNNHCYAGYLIAEELGYKEAIFSGYAKEAKDAGDKNANTHFELADRDATNYGAKLFAAGKSSKDCHEAGDIFK